MSYLSDLIMFPIDTIRELCNDKVLAKEPEIIRFINHQDSEGRTALHFAAIKDNQEVLEFLIESGANLFIEDKNGNKAYDLCNKGPLKKTLFQRMNERVMDYEQNKMFATTKQKSQLYLNNKTCRLEIGKEEFVSKSNEELEDFKFGMFKDNALTFMIRTGQFDKVKYLLDRRVDIMVSNSDN